MRQLIERLLRLLQEGRWHIALDVALALIVMYSGVIAWQSNRIEADCFCTSTEAHVISVVAVLVVALFVVILTAIGILAWQQAGRPPLRPFLLVERQHIVAAIVPLSIAIIGILGLTVPSQTADMLSGLKGRHPSEIPPAIIPFAIGAMAWSLSTWFCARWAIDVENRIPQTATGWLAIWSPRLIALITGLAIVMITVEATGLCSWAAFVASLIAGLVFLFAVLRRHLVTVRSRVGLAPPPNPDASWRQKFNLDMSMAPGGAPVLLFVVVVSVGVILAYAIDPQIANILHAPGTVLLGLAGLTVIGTFQSKARARWTRVPILLILVALTTLLGQFDIGVNHDIRKIDGPPPPRGPALKDAAAQWLNKCGPGLVGPDGVLKVVLVSSAGGASRAGLWTLHALAKLEEEDPQFPRRVFAMSAVSGGALGATVWSALLAHNNFDCSQPVVPSDNIKRRDLGHAVLSQDFLAPVLAAWLSRDVPLGIVPLNIVLRRLGLRIDDRSATLEKAWEAAWTDTVGDDMLGSDFLSLWGAQSITINRPLLLLNGTDEDTGQPIVTAPISIVDQHGGSDGAVPATFDALWMLNSRVRTSTAILNASRFPVITSQGDIRLNRCPDGSIVEEGKCEDHSSPTQFKISIVDGGYFDNIGAGTTVRAAAALRTAFNDTELSRNGVKLRILVVGISNDPDRKIPLEDWTWLDPTGTEKGRHHEDLDQLMRCDGPVSTLQIGDKGLANALDAEIAPVLAIVATQSGHTALRMAELNEQFCSHHRDKTAPHNYVVLSLCPVGNVNRQISLPLNWVLPRGTLDLFAGTAPDHLDLPVLCGNDKEFAFYRDWAGDN